MLAGGVWPAVLEAVVLGFHDRLGARHVAQGERRRDDDHHTRGDRGDNETHRLGPGR